MSNSFTLREFTIPPRRETRSPLGFSDKARKNLVILDAMHKTHVFYPGIVLRAGILHESTTKTLHSLLLGIDIEFFKYIDLRPHLTVNNPKLQYFLGNLIHRHGNLV
jgi:hypothetical protein